MLGWPEVCLAGLPLSGWSLALVFGFVVPDLPHPGVPHPGVLGENDEEDDGGLVVDAPGGEALAVEGAFELRVGAFGVLAPPVQALVGLTGGGGDGAGIGVSLDEIRDLGPLATQTLNEEEPARMKNLGSNGHATSKVSP